MTDNEARLTEKLEASEKTVADLRLHIKTLEFKVSELEKNLINAQAGLGQNTPLV